jgi:lipopolysaccharide/colanic/teichoic acid biosynthesis glycosyltransferase
VRADGSVLSWRDEATYTPLAALVELPGLTRRQAVIKRCVDLVGACAGLVLAAPVLAVLAVCVKLDSPGPVLFVQTRVGRGGRPFRMLKLRTMRDGADAEKASLSHLNRSEDVRLFKIPGDPRVTAVGRVIRRWSLDELPQLWNVALGHMSLVGPRPFFESDLADYEAHHFRRLAVKPGITGLWQVSGRSDIVDFEDVVRLDRHYIEHWSLALDLRILVRTLPVVASRSGAY